LEGGALVLSGRGMCWIDEFENMSDNARSMLHVVGFPFFFQISREDILHLVVFPLFGLPTVTYPTIHKPGHATFKPSLGLISLIDTLFS
jgi:hypothetical protein